MEALAPRLRMLDRLLVPPTTPAKTSIYCTYFFFPEVALINPSTQGEGESTIHSLIFKSGFYWLIFQFHFHQNLIEISFKLIFAIQDFQKINICMVLFHT